MRDISFLAAMAVRTSIIALIAVAGLRLSGKRQLGQLNVYDLAMVMALANAVQNAMTRGSGDLLAGAVSATALLVVAFAVTTLVVRRPALEARLVGQPTLLVYNGQLIRTRLRRCGVTSSEVMTAVRERGIADLADVWSVTLEVDGTLSVIPRQQDETHR